MSCSLRQIIYIRCEDSFWRKLPFDLEGRHYRLAGAAAEALDLSLGAATGHCGLERFDLVCMAYIWLSPLPFLASCSAARCAALLFCGPGSRYAVDGKRRDGVRPFSHRLHLQSVSYSCSRVDSGKTTSRG